MRGINIKRYLLIIVLVLACLAIVSAYRCTVYFTGIGCPHCAITDPVVLKELPLNYDNLIIIEYEIYQQQENARLLLEYDEIYNSGLGIPLIILDKEKHIVGSNPILKNIDSIANGEDNRCPLINSSVNFEDINLNALPGKPKIWFKDRILMRVGNKEDNNEILHNLLFSDNINKILRDINYTRIEAKAASLSGSEVGFRNAIQLNSWIFEWERSNENDVILEENQTNDSNNNNKDSGGDKEDEYLISDNIQKKNKLTIAKITSLAVVDAVNPCAIAVLTLMLISIMTYNPKKRSKVLFAGLAFALAVFIGYLIYGLIIIKFFELIQFLTNIRLMVYKGLGVIAIILGILNIKDFVRYKSGGFGTEMPLALRPKVKRLLSKVTSPTGAFAIGLFVTVFLLPCTIGPYIIAGGILSFIGVIKSLPWLLYYNLIFILPMLIITFIVYSLEVKIESVSGWKDRNIKILHLVAGIIMFILGLAMVIGWI